MFLLSKRTHLGLYMYITGSQSHVHLSDELLMILDRALGHLRHAYIHLIIRCILGEFEQAYNHCYSKHNIFRLILLYETKG